MAVVANLPFVVKPRLEPIKELIGSEESGQIEIERRGYLTSGEKAFIAQARSGDVTSTRLIGFARQLSGDYKIDLKEAYDLVTKVISGTTDDERGAEIYAKYSQELDEILQLLAASQAKEQLLQATCLMMYRVNLEWSVDDTMDLHPDIVEGLAALFNDEENKSIAALNPELKKELSVEELEKKPKKAATTV